MLEEEITVPGEPPGVYGCDYRRLAGIAVLHAGARLDLLRGDSAVSFAIPFPPAFSVQSSCRPAWQPMTWVDAWLLYHSVWTVILSLFDARCKSSRALSAEMLNVPLSQRCQVICWASRRAGG